jgi:hypothetical protein
VLQRTSTHPNQEQLLVDQGTFVIALAPTLRVVTQEYRLNQARDCNVANKANLIDKEQLLIIGLSFDCLFPLVGRHFSWQNKSLNVQSSFCVALNLRFAYDWSSR